MPGINYLTMIYVVMDSSPMYDKYVEDSAVQRDPFLKLSGRRKQFLVGG